MVKVKVSTGEQGDSPLVFGGGSRAMRPLRLVAQDIGFSAREQGFDSPRGYYGILYTIARIRNKWQKALVF